MNYRGNYSDGSGYRPKFYLNQEVPIAPYSKLSLQSSAAEFKPFSATEFKPSSTAEFKPSLSIKSLNALATDFTPGPPPKANLNSDAPIFELSFLPTKIQEKVPEKIPEFIPEKLPDEKYDEPIFIINNRNLTEEDFDLLLVQDLILVNAKNVYSCEDILGAYKEIRTSQNFEKVPENIKTFGTRAIITYRSKRGKAKENHKNLQQDWRESENAEIVSSLVWRRPKTEEEEKIIAKAKAYKTKLTGTKEEHEKIQRKIKITLNKLSPTNIDKLKEQLLDIGKENVNCLIFLVQCIFEKAWSEVKYTQMYASLCKFLKEKFDSYSFPELATEAGYMRKNLFKYELLERCEKSFTQAPCEDFTGLSEEEIEQKKSLAKKKTLGNVRFIGELFKVELITSKVILSCVDELITKSSQDEGNLEGACILLSTGGLSFERPKLVKETDRIFKILEEIMKKDTLSTKIKFKIMDLVDERDNKWKKNFKEEVKTVQEIHQDFEIELQKKKRMN